MDILKQNESYFVVRNIICEQGAVKREAMWQHNVRIGDLREGKLHPTEIPLQPTNTFVW